MKSYVKIILFFLFFSYSIFPASFNTETGIDLEQVTDSDIDPAIHKLSHWIIETEKQGKYSPEAHHNLASLYSRKKDYINAVIELFESTKLYKTPWNRSKEIYLIKEIQRTIGIQNSPFESSWALFLFSISDEVLLCLIIISVWSFILYYYYQQKYHHGNKLFLWSGVLCFAILLSFCISLKLYGNMGIVKSTEEAAVFNSSQLNEKLVTLPGGTLVRIRKSSTNAHQILEPVFGWIGVNDLILKDLRPYAQWWI